MTTVLIVPSLKVSGGIREVLRLATEATAAGVPIRVLSLWRSPHALHTDLPVDELSDWPPLASRALTQLFTLMHRFTRYRPTGVADEASGNFVFTHYATFPLALFVPRSKRLFFVQDLEWRFIGNRLASAVLSHFIKAAYRTGRLISANAYLTQSLRKEGLEVAYELPIWADLSFQSAGADQRDIDFVMVLRKGAHKRLDLYLRFIDLVRKAGQRVAVITPEDEIAGEVAPLVHHIALRPNTADMRQIYGRARCFIHASEHEGFGLPPLEAMGSGCVPLCRDSGGVQAYMKIGPLADLLVPLQVSIEDFHRMASALIGDDKALRAYSDAAREIFAHGAEKSSQARGGLVDALQ